ncbi:MAG: hypothetical protein RIB60_01915 [Phycisphaerales bacterium]
MAAERAYLSIVDWPAGWDAARRVEALVGAAGLDPHSCQLLCARETPLVIGMIDALIAEDVVSALHAEGVSAIAPSGADLAGWPDRERVKSFHLFEDRSALGVEFWRGEPCVIRANAIRLIVVGESRTTSVTVRQRPGTASTIEGAMLEYATESGVTRDRTTTEALLMDLYVAEDVGVRRLRVDADKMSFDVLGDAKGYADRPNMKALAALLGSVARQGTLDEGFARFSVPPEARRRATGSAGRTVAFDFYSDWLGCLYRSYGAL